MTILSSADLKNLRQGNELSALHWTNLRLDRMDAEEMPALFGFYEPIVDVFNITKRMGVGLFYLPEHPKYKRVDGLLQMRNGNPQIFINRNFPIVRQRFTVAHELGHLLRHRLENDKVLFRATDFTSTTMRDEREANVFAAELLMPESMVRNLVHLAPVRDLAQMFGVSEQAMAIRIRDIYR